MPRDDRKVWLVAAGCVFLFSAAVVSAQAVDPVVMVEEDWELVVYEPDGDIMAPQLHTVMSPFAELDPYYAQFSWNYREVPSFQPGGFQVQAWADDNVLIAKSFDLDKFSLQQEKFTWTQVMGTDGQYTRVAVVDGYSLTWGTFGGIEALIGDFVSLGDLSGYSTDVSVKNSLITYGANRVKTFRIVEVRYHGPDGLLYRDTTPRVVHSVD